MSTIKIIILAIVMMLTASASQAQNSINITNYTAYEKDGSLYVDWAADNSETVNYFEVQESNDGATFKTIAIVLGPDPRKAADQYGFSKKVAKKFKKATYLRLRHIDHDGKEQLSTVIQPKNN